ncbi:hypothetical protein ACRJ4W_13315 [Streptomyces sp. GLT-R25]
MHALLARLGDTPAFVLGRRTDILASNRMARALLADFGAMPVRDPNAVLWVILDEAARSVFAQDWEKAASVFVGILRMDADRHPDDTRTAELVEELSIPVLVWVSPVLAGEGDASLARRRERRSLLRCQWPPLG